MRAGKGGRGRCEGRERNDKGTEYRRDGKKRRRKMMGKDRGRGMLMRGRRGEDERKLGC